MFGGYLCQCSGYYDHAKEDRCVQAVDDLPKKGMRPQAEKRPSNNSGEQPFVNLNGR